LKDKEKPMILVLTRGSGFLEQLDYILALIPHDHLSHFFSGLFQLLQIVILFRVLCGSYQVAANKGLSAPNLGFFVSIAKLYF
jgi:hypothetical protein